MTADVRDLRHSPLEHLREVFAARATAGEWGVSLRELPFLSQVNVRLDPDGPAAARIAAVLGVSLPTTPNTVVNVGAGVNAELNAGVNADAGSGGSPGMDTGSGDLQLVWLGPDEWLIIGPDGTGSRTVRLLRAALGDETGSIVDVSANRTTLELSGPVARHVLEKGCTLDLHPRAFTSGSCAQTLVSKVNVLLVQVGPIPAYRLLVRGSFAQFLADWLLDAMDEYRFARTGV